MHNVDNVDNGVGARFLDIQKAFDRAWHNGWRYELLHMNAPALLLRWISSFLRDRIVEVRILGHTSTEIEINYGVPQGSPISPLLFLLYMSKLPKLLSNTRRSLFDDDFMIYSESSITRSALIQPNLETYMDDLTLFNADHRIILRCTKSVKVLFERQKNKMLKPQDITYNGQVIPSSSSVKFLGITFDSALTFQFHFRTVTTLSRHRLLKMNSIFSSTYGPSTSTFIRLYKSFIRSLFDYGALATCVASPNVQRSWERIQTHFISRALSIPSFIRNDRKRQHAYLPPIHDRDLYLVKRWYSRAMQHNRWVQDYIDNHTHKKRKNRGASNTPLTGLAGLCEGALPPLSVIPNIIIIKKYKKTYSKCPCQHKTWQKNKKMGKKRKTKKHIRKIKNKNKNNKMCRVRGGGGGICSIFSATVGSVINHRHHRHLLQTTCYSQLLKSNKE